MIYSTPYLLFDGNCADAMNFYHQCIGGDLTVTNVDDTPMKDQFPSDKHGRIINARLKSGAIDISASDWMASPEFNPVTGNTSAIYITGDTYDELKPVFDKLKDGENNERLQDLHATPFGIFGQFYDKFGVQWIFVGNKKPEDS